MSTPVAACQLELSRESFSDKDNVDNDNDNDGS
jgi:hypothetical protein